METSSETTRELQLLEQIQADPDINQATLADRLGVAVGTVNWHLKRMVAKGYVKVKRAQRRKLRYIITTEGIAFRAMLTVDYIEQSFRLYRRIRNTVREIVGEIKEAGFTDVRITGNGEIAEVCRLTCLDLGINVSDDESFPALQVEGLSVELVWPDSYQRPMQVNPGEVYDTKTE